MRWPFGSRTQSGGANRWGRESPRAGSRGLIAGAILLLTLVSFLPMVPVARAEARPALTWIGQFGSSADDGAKGVRADVTGLYVYGSTLGGLPGQTNAGDFDYFVRMYHHNGTEAWTRQFGGPQVDFAQDLALHDTGIYVVGTTGQLPFEDAFVQRMTTDGDEVWYEVFGTSDFDIPEDVAVDDSGVYVTGQTCGVLPGQTRSSECDAYVTKYSLDGSNLWTHQFGTPECCSAGQALVVNGTVAYVAGFVQGALPGQEFQGGTDIFLRTYSPTGTEGWTIEFGTQGYEWVEDMAIDMSDPDAPAIYLGTWGDDEAQGSKLRGFSSEGVESWSRQVDIHPTAVFADATGAYIGGILPTDPYPTGDAWVGKYDKSGGELWNLSFGTPEYDAIGGIASDAGNGLYFAGTTLGALPGQTHLGGGDAFVVRYDQGADSTPPVLSVPSDFVREATEALGAVVEYDATAEDVVDGAIQPICTPPSGSMFSLGSTVVTCTATDAAGNTATASFAVRVQDTTSPSLILPPMITVEATGPEGAVVRFSARATDLVDPSPVLECFPASDSTFPLGITTVECTAMDFSGNEVSNSFRLVVRDTTKPALSLPEDIVVAAASATGAPVAFTVRAHDTVDASPVIACDPASGTHFAIGTTTVTCTARDSAGNVATGTFAVTVRVSGTVGWAGLGDTWVLGIVMTSIVAAAAAALVLSRRRKRKAP